MTSNPIRYRFAVLLIWAAMALVTNPVWHALSHNHVDDPQHVSECDSDTQWAVQDLCPYCDAVTQFVELPMTGVSIVPVVLQRDLDAFAIQYPDLRLRLSTRLRAPPYLA